MEEQSHKDEMRAALRGDFERMRRRLSQGSGEPPATPVAAEPSTQQPQGGGAEQGPGSWLGRFLGRA